MNLQPLEDRIVVRPSEGEATTASGLVIPDSAKEKATTGRSPCSGSWQAQRHHRRNNPYGRRRW